MQNEVGNRTEEQGKEADEEEKITVERVEGVVRDRGRGDRQMGKPGSVCFKYPTSIPSVVV